MKLKVRQVAGGLAPGEGVAEAIDWSGGRDSCIELVMLSELSKLDPPDRHRGIILGLF